MTDLHNRLNEGKTAVFCEMKETQRLGNRAEVERETFNSCLLYPRPQNTRQKVTRRALGKDAGSTKTFACYSV